MVDHTAFQSDTEVFETLHWKAYESFEMDLMDYCGTVKNSNSAESDLIIQVNSGCFRPREYF